MKTDKMGGDLREDPFTCVDLSLLMSTCCEIRIHTHSTGSLTNYEQSQEQEINRRRQRAEIDGT